MKILAASLATMALSIALSGCAGGYVGGDFGGPVAMADCGGYYDGFYGPVDDGCWGSDGAFWYHSADYGWRRDEGRHFDHVRRDGAREFHGRGPGEGHAFREARRGGDPRD
jgi:hypothetical protein